MVCVVSCSRLRFLPPIDDNSFHLVRSQAVAVLDSFPVGMHLPVLEAMAAGVPVVRRMPTDVLTKSKSDLCVVVSVCLQVSAPLLQECTNSYAQGIAKSLNLDLVNEEVSSFSWPSSPEEYAVLAMRLAREPYLRQQFNPRLSTQAKGAQAPKNSDHASQIFGLIEQSFRDDLME
jgi:hypothetical protein